MTIFDELIMCREMIEDSLELANGCYEFDDIAAAVLLGTYHLYRVDDACAVTQIVNTPRRRILNVVVAGGNLDTIKKNQGYLIGLAKQHGCDMISAIGRKGWGRAMGWDESRSEIVRDV